MSEEQREALADLEGPKVVVKIVRSSCRDGGLGYELRVGDAATDDDVTRTIERSLRGHEQLKRGVEEGPRD